MARDFAYKARQYFDFSSHQHEEENVESYFEMNHEVEATDVTDGDVTVTETINISDDEVFYSPLKPIESNAAIYLKGHLRRSISVDNLFDPNKKGLSNGLNSLRISGSHNSYNQSTTSLNSAKLVQNHRTFSKESLNRLAKPKHQFKSVDNLAQKDYVSMAEAVKRFHVGTPQRFRSRPTSRPVFKQAMPGPTRPLSPKLTTKNRSRPAHVISHEEQEQLEAEEAKKFKIKANPVNRKILRAPAPIKAQVETRPTTVPEPFNIRAVQKKVVEIPPTDNRTFLARPAPKTTKVPFKTVPLPSRPLTEPKTPNLMKRTVKCSPRKVGSPKKDARSSPKPLTKTQPVPFSFEKRYEQLKKKKEEMMNKVLEEEKKAREFHAKPPPRMVLRSRNDSSGSNSSTKTGHKNDEQPPAPTFKARPATVLKKKPFEPKKDEHHFVEFEEFQLSTDHRARERREFESMLREKEERRARVRERGEQELRRLEEEERARLRKAAEVKAQPIKKYKEVHIVPSNKVTEPISPKFHTDRIRNKENISGN